MKKSEILSNFPYWAAKHAETRITYYHYIEYDDRPGYESLVPDKIFILNKKTGNIRDVSDTADGMFLPDSLTSNKWEKVDPKTSKQHFRSLIMGAFL